jgi:hypothetical protein
MSSSDKRKQKTLTSSAKAEIIKKLDKDEKLNNLGKEHGVGHAMMYDIRKNRKEEQLKSRDGLIKAMFLPPNCTPLLQSTDQNVIHFVKSQYKKSLLCSVISQNDDIIQCLKRTNLKDAVVNLAHAWQNMPPKTILSSWKKLWPSHPLSSCSSELTGPEESENDGTVLTYDLQEAIAELCKRTHQVQELLT